MPLHRLTTITLGVPDVDAAVEFYEDFGLETTGDKRLSSADGGEHFQTVATHLPDVLVVRAVELP